MSDKSDAVAEAIVYVATPRAPLSSSKEFTPSVSASFASMPEKGVPPDWTPKPLRSIIWTPSSLFAETIYNLKPLRATVKKNNNTSYLFFDRNGYSIKSEDKKCWIFIKA